MFLLRQVNKDPLLHSFEQFYIQLYYDHHNKLIPKQNTGERNPMYELIFDPKTQPRSLAYLPHLSTVNTFQTTGCSNYWYAYEYVVQLLFCIF
jgi:hypothetical protein